MWPVAPMTMIRMAEWAGAVAWDCRGEIYAHSGNTVAAAAATFVTCRPAPVLAHRCEHAIQRRVTLVQPAFHPRLEKAVALLGGEELRCGDQPGGVDTRHRLAHFQEQID